jgi:methylphosphotriester-DNA--protein-cysteine methyltransferase
MMFLQTSEEQISRATKLKQNNSTKDVTNKDVTDSLESTPYHVYGVVRVSFHLTPHAERRQRRSLNVLLH